MSRKRSRPSKSPRMAPLPPHHFMGPEVHKLAVISTGHLPRTVVEEIEADPSTVQGPYGFLLWVTDVVPTHTRGYPIPVIDVIHAWARKNGFGYVLFDCDAPIISDLPFFDW